MNNILSTLPLPEDYAALINLSSSLWITFVGQLRGLTPDELDIWVQNSLKYLSMLAKYRKSDDYKRLCVGLMSIYHFFLNDISPLEPLIQTLYSSNEVITMQLATYCISNIAKSLPPNNDSFSKKEIELALNLIKPEKSGYQNKLFGLFLLRELSNAIPLTFLLHSGDVPNQIWDLLINSYAEIRMAASQVLERYLNILVKYQGYRLREIFNNLMVKTSTHIMNNPSDCPQGALVVLSLLLKQKGQFFKNQSKVIFDTASGFYKTKGEVKAIANYVLAELSEVDSSIFSDEVFNDLFNVLRKPDEEYFSKYTDSVVLLINNIGPEKFQGKENQIYKFILDVMKFKKNDVPTAVFDVLRALLDKMPGVLQRIDLWSIISHFLFTSKFADLFPEFEKKIPDFWIRYSNDICDRVINILNDLKSSHYSKMNAVKLLTIIPSSSAYQKTLATILRRFLLSKSQEELIYAPKALLHITANSSNLEIHQTLHQIIDIATGHESDNVRVSCLNSFSEAHFPILASPIFLDFFSSLSQDSSPRVRSTCFKVLKKLRNYSPLSVDVILRHSIVDSFFSLQCSNTIAMQEQIAEVLPSLVSASPELSHIYSSTFVPIILNLLAQRFATGKAKQTNPLDPELRTQLALYLVQTLHELVKNKMPIIDKFLPKLLSIFTTILGEWGDKRPKQEVLSTLFDLFSANRDPGKMLSLAPNLLPTVLRLVENCSSQSLSLRALKFLGLCGAVSPRHLKQETKNSANNLPDLFLLGNAISYNDYFVDYVYQNLRPIFYDKSLNALKMKAIAAAVEALDVNSLKPALYFNELVPLIISEVENAPDEVANDTLILLQQIIFVAGQRIITFIDRIITLVHKVWRTSLIPNLLLVIAALVDQAKTDFEPYAAPLIRNILDIVTTSLLSKPADAVKCIPLLATICPAFQHLSSLMIPRICDIANTDSTTMEIKMAALNSLRFLVQNTNISENKIPILRTALMYCVKPEDGLREAGLQVLYSLMVRLGSRFNVYMARTVEKLTQNKITDQFIEINKRMLAGIEIKFSDFSFIDTGPLLHFHSFSAEHTEFVFNQNILLQQFDSPNMTTPKHYQNWFTGFIQCIIQNSPSVSIRSCAPLCTQHRPLALSIFFPAFLSCWILLSGEYQAAISLKLSVMFSKVGLPPDVMQTFALLCEYMDRAEKPILISQASLTQFYSSTHCFALALHNEQERFFQQLQNNQNNSDIINNIVNLYTQLGRSSAAKSLLFSPTDDKDWLLRLGQWSQAFEHFQEVHQVIPEDDEGFVGYVISSCRLRKYGLIRDMDKEFAKKSADIQLKVSSSFSEAFFFIGDFQKMYEYSKKCSSESVDGHIIHSLSCILLKKNEEAQATIDSGFALISAQSAPMFGRRYESIYDVILQCQVLYELQDFLQNGIVDQQPTMRQLQWENRLKNADYTSDVWWPLIMIRKVASSKNTREFIEFGELILHERKYDIFKDTLSYLFPGETSRNFSLCLLKFKYMWDRGKKERMAAYSNILAMMDKAFKSNVLNPKMIAYWFDWTLELKGQSLEVLMDVKNKFKVFYQYCRYDIIWQRWALVNYHLYSLDRSNTDYALDAIKGYMSCINQNTDSKSNHFAEVIQFLSLFFATADVPSIYRQTEQWFKNFDNKYLIGTIPQLIAQLSHSNKSAVKLIQEKLIKIGHDNIQPLLFPLLVASMSNDPERVEAASTVLTQITKEHPIIMTQAKKIQKCLLLVAITKFEKSSSLIVKYLDQIEAGKKQEADATFKEITKLFTTNTSPLDDIFYQNNKFIIEHEFDDEELKAQLYNMLYNNDEFMDMLREIYVNDVCQELKHLQDTEIAVPGAPQNVLIHHFGTMFTILGSKKRPRKCTIFGNNGCEYKYLLKGNEDLRLDQRVMQFFKLINIQIEKDISLSIDNVSIRNYAIIPLSTEVGLIQWVEGCDTFHNLISEYRISHKIEANMEHKMIENMSIPKINLLTPMQRYEAIEEVMETTDSGDLRKIFWLKSPSSDAWLERTTKFARSTALMSIVGYVLGLGDRHPSNFMIDRNSGDVVHIDFGDCFEVARNRVLYSEMVPFRLTRMIVSAFGACKIEGEFRPVAERVMMLIRDNCNSLISILEIFVQEPIVEGETQFQADSIMTRVWNKIKGNDFDEHEQLVVDQQVDKLITAALDHYNLAKLYDGWCPLW